MSELRQRAKQICDELGNVCNPNGGLARELARNAELAMIAEYAYDEGFEDLAKELRSIAAALKSEK
jgi:hypothetical protein